MVWLFAATFAAVCFGACVEPVPADPFVATVTWLDEDEAGHQTYRESQTLVCPEAPECTASGLALTAPDDAEALLVMARSERHASVRWEVDVDGGPVAPPLRLRALSYHRYPTYTTGITDVDQWNALSYRRDAGLGRSASVKFYVRALDGDPEVYFIASDGDLLHYSFAAETLGFEGTRSAYDAATYHDLDRSANAGYITYYPDLTLEAASFGATLTSPWVVEFYPGVTLPEELLFTTLHLVEDRLDPVARLGTDNRLVYLPPNETAADDLEGLVPRMRAEGLAWIHGEDLYSNITEQVLNEGLAYGYLRWVTPEELTTAAVTYRDILVLPRIPNDLPIVGGTITGEHQTPLAHVNVAARARGTPNVAVIGVEDDPRIAPYLDALVRFEASDGAFTITPATLDEATAFWGEERPDLQIPEADDEESRLLSFSSLGYASYNVVGSKAANVAELANHFAHYTYLQGVAPHGFAVPFHYYDRHMRDHDVTDRACIAAAAACRDEGRDAERCDEALAQCRTAAANDEDLYTYAARITDTEPTASDPALREAALASLRHVIRNADIDRTFGAALDARITSEFGDGRVRLRSSTNAEDLANFSGAGLYTSVGSNGSGGVPSDEIREVWASVWSWKAVEERTFWNVSHQHVRMGVLVHQAYREEQANGVLITENIGSRLGRGYYVNVQLGETPVTNPENGATPEVFTIFSDGDIARERFSSLSPDAPILTDVEIVTLYNAAHRAMCHMSSFYLNRDPDDERCYSYPFEIEFKFNGPDRDLVIKQIRPYLDD